MNLEFKIYEIKETSMLYKQLVEGTGINEFILVGESKVGDIECYKAQSLDSNGITLIGDMKIDYFCLEIPKKDFKPLGSIYDTTTFDIPKKHLTMEAIESIQRLNTDDYEICKHCGEEMQISVDYKYKKCINCGNMELEEWASAAEVW